MASSWRNMYNIDSVRLCRVWWWVRCGDVSDTCALVGDWVTASLDDVVAATRSPQRYCAPFGPLTSALVLSHAHYHIARTLEPIYRRLAISTPVTHFGGDAYKPPNGECEMRVRLRFRRSTAGVGARFISISFVALPPTAGYPPCTEPRRTRLAPHGYRPRPPRRHRLRHTFQPQLCRTNPSAIIYANAKLPNWSVIVSPHSNCGRSLETVAFIVHASVNA